MTEYVEVQVHSMGPLNGLLVCQLVLDNGPFGPFKPHTVNVALLCRDACVQNCEFECLDIVGPLDILKIFKEHELPEAYFTAVDDNHEPWQSIKFEQLRLDFAADSWESADMGGLSVATFAYEKCFPLNRVIR